jgi:predicted patatin/cPLA2 family phospholipase
MTRRLRLEGKTQHGYFHDAASPRLSYWMTTMKNSGDRIGLALSGGGFRATLFHLGVIKFLFDEKQLETVGLVSAVSGGSVLAAHLILNWKKYTGT